MKPMIVLLLLGCGVLGCNTATREQELQQQKLLTELAKTNTESLAEMSKKQAELRNRELELTKKDEEFKARENAIQESLGRVKEQEETLHKQVKEREESLHKRESTATQREREVAQKYASEETRIQEEKDVLNKERERLNVARSQVQAIARQQEAERLARQAVLREQEAYKNSEDAKRAEGRKAELERLAELATDLVMIMDPGLVRSKVQKAVVASLAKPVDFRMLGSRQDWGYEDEDEFVDEALKTCEFAIRGAFSTSGGSFWPDKLQQIERDLPRKMKPALEKWKNEYLQAHQTKAGSLGK
ncbi:MAG: hypothetical protein WCJ35_03300 [Planctomycetota bacterium]